MLNSWHYLTNQFLVATRNNYKKAFGLSNYHNAALQQVIKDNPDDADYTMLFKRYDPIHLKFVNAYIAWDSSGGNQQSETLNVSQLMAQMTDRLDDWEPDILKVCKKKTPAFKKIFPDERKPFYRGGIDDRIAAIKTLAENIGDNPKLQEIKQSVLDYWESVDTARTTQDGSKNGKGQPQQRSRSLPGGCHATPICQYRLFDEQVLPDTRQSGNVF